MQKVESHDNYELRSLKSELESQIKERVKKTIGDYEKVRDGYCSKGGGKLLGTG